jgi:hypothetical protein
MRNKFLLINLDSNGEVMFKREVKTLRELETILKLDYQTIQRFYRLCKKTNIKGIHSLFKDLYNKFRVVDNIHTLEL